MEKKGKIDIHAGKVVCKSLFLLYLTNIIFLIGWMKLAVSIPVCLITSIGYFFVRRIILEKCSFHVSLTLRGVIFLCIPALLMVWVCGIGGFFPQAYDYVVRNPIYRDLVLNSWPVVYTDTNRALCYYFGYWLLPALLSKGCFFWSSEYMIWQGAQIVLFLYTVMNIILVELLICILISDKGKREFSLREIIKVILAFCAWGGAPIGGYYVFKMIGISADVIRPSIAELTLQELWQTGTLLEHYARDIAIVNGNITQLANVFNQSVPAWLATAVFLIMRDEVSVFAYIGFLLLISAPFPVIGLGLMMFSIFCKKIIYKEVKIQEVFSVPNICSLPILFVGILFYRKTVDSNLHIVLKHFYKDHHLQVIVVSVLIVAFFAFGIYMVMVGSELKDHLYYASQIIFVGCYFVGIGSEGDLAMRAVIPMYFYFMILIMQTMFYSSISKWRKHLLAGIIGISGVIQLNLIFVLGKMYFNYGTFKVPYDFLYTFSNNYGTYDNGYIDQYTKLNPSADIFFGKLCKGRCDITKPVIEYAGGIDENGDEHIYVKKVSIKKEYIEEFMKSVVCADEQILTDRLQKECAVSDDPVVVYFDANELKPRMENDLVFSEEDFTLSWTNYKQAYHQDKTNILANIELEYAGEEPIQIWQKSNPERESGIACALYDEEGNLVYEPWAYTYTKHVLYSGQKERYVIGIPKPENRGSYKLVFCFFYNQNQVYAKYSQKEYLLEIN